MRRDEFSHTETMPPGTEWPHVTRANATPRALTDPYWVRAVFNGDVVRVMPLGHFKEALGFYRTGGIAQRRKECGPFDPKLSWAWAQPPQKVIADSKHFD